MEYHFLERMTKYDSSDLGIWNTLFQKRTLVCHFKENNKLFLVNDKIQTFKQNLEYWKTCNSYQEFDSFLTHGRHFLILLVIVKKGDCIVMCQHLGDLHNSLNLYVPTNHWMMTFKAQNRPIDFNIPGQKKFIWLQILHLFIYLKFLLW